MGKHFSDISLLFLLIITATTVNSQTIKDSPITFAKKVADKIMRETSFEFSLSQHIPSSTIQTIDFNEEIPRSKKAVYYALSFIPLQNDSIFTLGISHNTAIKIWVNGQPIYSNENGIEPFKEIAYDRYQFTKNILVPLKKGENSILVKSLRMNNRGVVQLALLDSAGYIHEVIFTVRPFFKKDSVVQRWLFIGQFNGDSNNGASLFSIIFPPEISIAPYYILDKQKYVWQLPKTQLELNDVIPATASFKQHSYFEWHYANGQTALAVQALADATKENVYSDFIKKYCDITLEMYDYFRYQYESLHNRTGFNYRLFRKSMLDDSSAPVLPFIELYLRGKIPESKPIIDTIAYFVTHEQTRLFDGTLCRPEPEALTVWADDLFMGVPFLLRYAKMTGDKKYYDDAVLQIINYHKYLFDAKSGLTSHCWYDQRKKQGVAHWGRANGWMIWAISEVLNLLPRTHKEYKKIEEIFRQRIKGIVQYQDEDGMWHQVLDHSESYKETSCSAMFVLAIARGVRNGWIGKKYLKNAIRGWEGVIQQIGEDGTVSGICQGTGIGETLEFYFKRKTPKHDPRGLGAVITAGVEMEMLLDGQ